MADVILPNIAKPQQNFVFLILYLMAFNLIKDNTTSQFTSRR